MPLIFVTDQDSLPSLCRCLLEYFVLQLSQVVNLAVSTLKNQKLKTQNIKQLQSILEFFQLLTVVDFTGVLGTFLVRVTITFLVWWRLLHKIYFLITPIQALDPHTCLTLSLSCLLVAKQGHFVFQANMLTLTLLKPIRKPFKDINVACTVTKEM